MSELPTVSCAGAPRDLGLDQGTALRDAIARAARAVASPARLVRAQRAALRHFPHAYERALGLALGARIADARALALQAALGDAGAAVCCAASRSESGSPLIGRALGPHALFAEPDFVVRTSAPDTDFRSVELVWAWGVAGLVGVNEHGVAVAACAGEGAGAETGAAVGAVTAGLLAQDCLQRFDAVEKAIDWLMRRPAEGSVSLLLADASGATARVEVDGEKRWVVEAAADAPSEAPGIAACGAADVAAALAAQCTASERHDAVSLLAALRHAQPRARVCAIADPATRRLGVAVDGGVLRWYAGGG